MAEQVAVEQQKQEEEEEDEPESNGQLPQQQQQQQVGFDPSRMIGIIRRKALIKDLAAVYHAECLSYCQELLELQKRWEETYVDIKASEDMQRETMRQPKRLKRSR